MLRTVVTFVYIIWPLQLGAFSVGAENYYIPFPESKDMNFSALSDAFVLQKEMFNSSMVPEATWRPEPYAF